MLLVLTLIDLAFLTSKLSATALIEFIRYFFVHNESITFSMDNFEKEKKFIEKHFEGDLMDFALRTIKYTTEQKADETSLYYPKENEMPQELNQFVTLIERLIR